VVATNFHRFPTYFLVANVVVVPLAGVMLGLSLAYMAVPCAVTAWPLDLLIRLAEWVTAQVASWPGAVVEI
jgi:predicted membrane metal-binding protein